MTDTGLSPTAPLASAAEAEPAPLFAGRILLGDRSLREHTARGVVVNGAFQVGLVTIGLLKGVIVAAFLTPGQYGVWGILLITLITVTWLKQVGVGDRYVQQDEADQELVFQQAFTFELAVSAAFGLLLLGLAPLLGAIYGESRLVLPMAVIAVALPLTALQMPTSIFYRRMQFVPQRIIQAIEPVLSFAITVALAAAGVGYWSLVIGFVAGLAVAGAVALVRSPYRPALRLDRRSARAFTAFSWPLLVASGSSLVIAQVSIVVGEAELGLAGAGMITFASTVAQYSNKVDEVLTATIYPAICAVKDRTELMFEAFVASNRLSLMWGLPFGIGLALFAPELVRHVIGPQWVPATFLLQAFGLTMAVAHVGYNWDAFYRALGRTRPIALWSFASMLSFLVVPLPLLVTQGLDGYAWGMGVMAAVSLAIRLAYLKRLFTGFRIERYLARAIAPSLPAAGAVLAVRAAGAGSGSVAATAAELALYVAITLVATVWLERTLLGEVLGMLRGNTRGLASARA